MVDDEKKPPGQTVPVTSRGRGGKGKAAPTVAPSGERRTVLPTQVDSGRRAKGGKRFLGANDRYEIITQIGKGGFGRVYEAFDHNFGTRVAVKTLNVHDLEDDELDTFLRKFRDEARQIHPLEHQGIVRVYDYGEDGDQPFFVMPLIEGGTLRDRLKRDERLSSEDAVAVGLAVAEALDYVHGQHILHRDIKPENIFCATGGVYKVGDFGIAQHGTSKRATKSTFRGAGTPAYMSPEQIGAPANVDQRSDLFSLCVVLYEALTGERPYLPLSLDFDPEESKRSSDRARRAVERNFGEFTPIRTLAPDVPKKLAAVIERGIDPDPSKRFGSCQELSEALRDSLVEDETSSRIWMVAAAAFGVVVLGAVAFWAIAGGGMGSRTHSSTAAPTGVAIVAAIESPTPTPSPSGGEAPTPAEMSARLRQALAEAETLLTEGQALSVEIQDRDRSHVRSADTDLKNGIEFLEKAKSLRSVFWARDASRSLREAKASYRRALAAEREIEATKSAPSQTPTVATATASKTPTRSLTPTRGRTSTRTATREAVRTRTPTRRALPTVDAAAIVPTARRTNTRTQRPTPRHTPTRRLRPTPKKVNRSPEITGGPALNPASVRAGGSMTVSIATPLDPDGDRVTCRWYVAGRPLSSTGACGGRWDQAIEGRHSLKLVASDSQGGSTEKIWMLPVRAAAAEPVARPTAVPRPAGRKLSPPPQSAAAQLARQYCASREVTYAGRGQTMTCVAEGVSSTGAEDVTVDFTRVETFAGGVVKPMGVQCRMRCDASGCSVVKKCRSR